MSENDQKNGENKLRKASVILTKVLAISITALFASGIIIVSGTLVTGELVEFEAALITMLIGFIGLEVTWVASLFMILKLRSNVD